jgi:hypothetical protein
MGLLMEQAMATLASQRSKISSINCSGAIASLYIKS